ncbi:MAG: hypothetical protein NTZ50_16255, partial [Chloroflexi bacterium]|nr:hypothetical protein [Chloroflexota bacterium]
LTGLTVREDRGTDVAIAFEDPATDPNREDNGRLHALANGLGSTFLTARDADGDTARDVTVPTIKSRFDKGSNSASTNAQRWNLPANAFKVSTYSYANSDEQIRISMTETKSLLEANFYAAGNVLSSAPLLLFARESRMRNMSLDSAAASTGAQVTMNMDPVEVPQQTFVNVNWAPYQRVGGQWQLYPVDQYASKLTSDFQERFKNEPEDERAINVLLMQTTYLSILSGMNSVLREEGGRYVADADAASDGALSEATADLTDPVRLITNYINPQAAQMYTLLVGTSAVAVSTAEAKSKLKVVLKEVKTYGVVTKPTLKLIYGMIMSSGTKKIVFNPKYAKNFLFGALVGVAVMAAVGGFDGDAGSSVQAVLHVTGVVSEAATLTKMILIGKDVPKAGALLSAIIGADHALTVAKNMPEIMFVVQLAIVWGMAVYQLAVSPFSSALLFTVVASAVAQSIVALLMYAIYIIPGIGPIIAAVLGLIDALVASICLAVDRRRKNNGGTPFSETTAGKRVCAGISGLVAALIQNFLYSRRALIGNMYADDRLQFLNAGDMFTLVDPGAGIVQGANATVKLDVKNTIQRNTMFKSGEEMDQQIIPFPVDPLAIPYLWQYNDTNLKSSVFQYALQPAQSDFHDGLDRGSMSGEWTFEPGGKTSRYYILRTVQTTSRDLLAQAGVNRPIQLGLAEAQVLPVQQCFLLVFPPLPFPMIPICSIEADKSTNF